jgi:hypothetical protein
MGNTADDEGSVDGSSHGGGGQDGTDGSGRGGGGGGGGDGAPGSAMRGGVTSLGRFNVEPAALSPHKTADSRSTRFSVSDCPHETDEDDDSHHSPDEAAKDSGEGGPATLTESSSHAFQFPSPSPLRPGTAGGAGGDGALPTASTPAPGGLHPASAAVSLDGATGVENADRNVLGVDFAALLAAQNVELLKSQKTITDQLAKV